MREPPVSGHMREAVSFVRRYGAKAIMDPLGVYRENSKLKSHKRTVSFLESLDCSNSDLTKNREVMLRFSQMENVKVETANWFVPTFSHPFGGIYTILRFADYFRSEKGIKNRFIVCGENQIFPAELKKTVVAVFPNLADEEVIVLGKCSESVLPYSDISIATIWYTAYPLLKFNNTKGKFYFIQDYEPLFYPAGAIFAAAEMTYRFGFYGITNTVGLYEVYKREYGGTAQYFTPSVDKRLFYPSERSISKPSPDKPFTVIFYARPETPRNAFELGIATVKRLVEKHGKFVKILAAGSNWEPKDYGLENEISMLGILPYEETAKLYRQCDLGIVFMFTKHPSYLPFELMACGCPVLTNYNSATQWLLKDGDNCALIQPSISSVLEKIEELIENVDLRRRLIIGGLKSVGETTWMEEIEKVYKFITNSKGH